MRKKTIVLCSIFAAFLMLVTTVVAVPVKEKNVMDNIDISPITNFKEYKSSGTTNENTVKSLLEFKKITIDDILEKSDMPDCSSIEFIIGFLAFLSIACGMELFAMFLLAHTLLPGIDFEDVEAVMYYLLDLVSG